MEIYDIRIAPNQTREINVTGSYVYFYNGSAGGADTTITIRQDSRGERVLLQPGQAYRMKAGETGSRWLIGNLRGAGTIVGQLVIGSGELTDNRITGSVEVIDGGRNRTEAGQAFIASFNVTSVALVRPSAILWNPPNSGRNLFLKSTRYSCSVTAPYGFNSITSLGTGLNLITSTAIVPKRIGTASVATAHSADASEFNGATTVFNSMVTAILAANQVDQASFSEPVQVSPGSGVRFFAATDSAGIICSIEYIEELI